MIDYEMASTDDEAELERNGENFRVTEFHMNIRANADQDGRTPAPNYAWVGAYSSVYGAESKLPGARGVILCFGSVDSFSTSCSETLNARVFIPINSARRLASRLVEYAAQSEAANAAEKLE